MAEKQGGIRILVCDDDELLRDFYSRVIRTRGYEVVCAENGDDAVELLKEYSDINLAVIDLLMPVRSGWELIEYMKGTPEYDAIPIIAVTGLPIPMTNSRM